MKKIIFLTLILWVAVYSISYSQKTLDIKFAEKLFSYSSKKIIDTLVYKGFKNLNDQEIFEDNKRFSSDTYLETKDKLYTVSSIRRSYELRKSVGESIYEISILMEEPKCNHLSLIVWSDNYTNNAKKYVNEVISLDYEEITGEGSKFQSKNKKFILSVEIDKRNNLIIFVLREASLK